MSTPTCDCKDCRHGNPCARGARAAKASEQPAADARKFCKVLDVEGTQIVAMLRSNERDNPSVRFLALIGGMEVESSVGWDSEGDWHKAEAAFDQITDENLLSVYRDFKNKLFE